MNGLDLQAVEQLLRESEARLVEQIRSEAHLTRCRMDVIEARRLRSLPAYLAEQAETRRQWIEGR